MVDELAAVIAERKANPPPGSYTAKLFAGGRDRILKKIGEEAGEVIIASKNDVAPEIVHEVSDLLYHTLVLLADHGIALDTVAEELRARRG
ncbi:MAG: phosphoribosyl-ATP diphosphatase [Myxococcales bacterium]|nr:phosphoribosyl-ATP diphosphatase [Myxococcales bacterium]